MTVRTSIKGQGQSFSSHLSDSVRIPGIPALVVRQRDSLRRHFELDHGGRGSQVAAQGGVGGLGDGLRAGQGLGLHRVQVEDVAG